MIVLAYLWVLALIPFLLEKEDEEIQWHAKHGLVLLAAEILFWIALVMFTFVAGFVTGGVGCLITVLSPVFWLAFVTVHVLCTVKGLGGQRFVIPYVSLYADRF